MVVSHALASGSLRRFRGAAPAQVGLLDRVLRVGDGAQHAVSDGEEERTVLENGSLAVMRLRIL